jgi:hypothetical protein
MVGALEWLFPHLRTTAYRITSPKTGVYNCIAWAAGDTTDWWWPISDPVDEQPFWPLGVVREVTLPAFVAVFAILGYAPCDGDTLDAAEEKVALFANGRSEPTQAARQLANGLWTSKLGNAEDIEHELHALEGDIYGTVVQILKRPRPA